MHDLVEGCAESRYRLVITVVCGVSRETGSAGGGGESVNAMDLPQLAGRPMVTEGGRETEPIFHHGVDLPLFAAFPLIDTAEGRSLLTAYYDEYAAIARRADAGLMLESATWRASSDWGDRLGYSPADLARVNRDAISMLAELRERYRDGVADVVISGMVGPRGDGYPPGEEAGPNGAGGDRPAAVGAVPAAGAGR